MFLPRARAIAEARERERRRERHRISAITTTKTTYTAVPPPALAGAASDEKRHGSTGVGVREEPVGGGDGDEVVGTAAEADSAKKVADAPAAATGAAISRGDVAGEDDGGATTMAGGSGGGGGKGSALSGDEPVVRSSPSPGRGGAIEARGWLLPEDVWAAIDSGHYATTAGGTVLTVQTSLGPPHAAAGGGGGGGNSSAPAAAAESGGSSSSSGGASVKPKRDVGAGGGGAAATTGAATAGAEDDTRTTTSPSTALPSTGSKVSTSTAETAPPSATTGTPVSTATTIVSRGVSGPGDGVGMSPGGDGGGLFELGQDEMAAAGRLSHGDFLRAEVEGLLLRCVNADPNYGSMWFHCRHRPSDTAK